MNMYNNSCFRELIDIVRLAWQINNNKTNITSLEAMQNHIKNILVHLEKNIWSGKLHLEHIEQIKYALIVTLDELIINSHLNIKQDWISNNLQFKVYGTNVGGEKFYNNLQLLTNNFIENQYVIEVYYLCLTLGFYGRYRFYDNSSRDLVILNLNRKLYSEQLEDKNFKFENKRNVASYLNIGSKWIALIVAFILGVGYFALHMSLNKKIEWVNTNRHSYKDNSDN